MKRYLAVLFSILCTSLLMCTAGAADVYIDGEKVEFTESSGYPFISAENRTLVPLRATMEAFGATVRWDGENSTAIVTKDSTTVTCKIGESCIYRNGTKIPNDAAASIVNGRTYLPIRAVLEALDATVGWDGSVTVSSPGAQTALINALEGEPRENYNFWAEWTKALSFKEQGKYAEAIEKIKEAAPTFLSKSDAASDAVLYQTIGTCYEELHMTEEAAACFMRESALWEQAGRHQMAIDAARRASFSHSEVQIFVSSDNRNYTSRKHFGVKYEPQNGILTGVTLKASDFGYISQFASLTGKEMAGGILYGYVSDFEIYRPVIEKARDAGKIIQFALQLRGVSDLQSITENDTRYVAFAKNLAKTNAMLLIRFACEMNDTENIWYTDDCNLYKEKYRYISDIFHKYAPNCAMVWSPNFYPSDTMEIYYPGDAYVDYVGISAYSEHQPETDPLKLGVDRSRFAEVLDTIAAIYGHKKPIIISESGASYRDIRTGLDITDFASRQLYDFYTYLPLKYPQVRAAYLFETVDAGGRYFRLANNEKYRLAYSQAISNPMYLSSALSDTASLPFTIEAGNNVSLPAQKVQLASFIKTLENDFSKVIYRINGSDIGTASSIPYAIEADLSAYSGQAVALTCLAYDTKGMLCASKTYNVKVD